MNEDLFWNSYLDEVKKKLEVNILAQSDGTCEFLHKERFGLFMEKLSPSLKAMARSITNWKELRVPLSPTKRRVPPASTATTVDCQRAMRPSNTLAKTRRPHWPR
jgi:hypothetical protein